MAAIIICGSGIGFGLRFDVGTFFGSLFIAFMFEPPNDLYRLIWTRLADAARAPRLR
jgi:hypothetical protein